MRAEPKWKRLNDMLTARRPDLIHLRVQGSRRRSVSRPPGQRRGRDSANHWLGRCRKPMNHVLPAWGLVTGMTVANGCSPPCTTVTAPVRAPPRGRALRCGAGRSGQPRVALRSQQRQGERPLHCNHVYGSFGTDFACADGTRVMVVALTAGQWAALTSATGTDRVFAALEERGGVR